MSSLPVWRRRGAVVGDFWPSERACSRVGSMHVDMELSLGDNPLEASKEGTLGDDLSEAGAAIGGTSWEEPLCCFCGLAGV